MLDMYRKYILVLLFFCKKTFMKSNLSHTPFVYYVMLGTLCIQYFWSNFCHFSSCLCTVCCCLGVLAPWTLSIAVVFHACSFLFWVLLFQEVLAPRGRSTCHCLLNWQYSLRQYVPTCWGRGLYQGTMGGGMMAQLSYVCSSLSFFLELSAVKHFSLPNTKLNRLHFISSVVVLKLHACVMLLPFWYKGDLIFSVS